MSFTCTWACRSKPYHTHLKQESQYHLFLYSYQHDAKNITTHPLVQEILLIKKSFKLTGWRLFWAVTWKYIFSRRGTYQNTSTIIITSFWVHFSLAFYSILLVIFPSFLYTPTLPCMQKSPWNSDVPSLRKIGNRQKSGHTDWQTERQGKHRHRKTDWRTDQMKPYALQLSTIPETS